VLVGSIDDVGAVAGDVGAPFDAVLGIHGAHGFCRRNQSGGGNRSLIAVVSLIDEIL